MPYQVGPSGKQLRGLACVPPEQRKRIASKGQQAARAAGGCYEFDHEKAVEAGRKGGKSPRRRLSEIAERTAVAAASGRHAVREVIGRELEDIEAEINAGRAAAAASAATAAGVESTLVSIMRGEIAGPVMTALGRISSQEEELRRIARLNQTMKEAQERVRREGMPAPATEPSPPPAAVRALERDIAELEQQVAAPPPPSAATPPAPVTRFGKFLAGLRNLD